MHSTSKARVVVYLISNRRLSEKTALIYLKVKKKKNKLQKNYKNKKIDKKRNTKICVCGEVGSDLQPCEKGCAPCHHQGEAPHATADECLLLFFFFFCHRLYIYTAH